MEKARKVGLGLSGGGFRASLFHIGVLACLAENNLLKDVEVISCVSGGSIIGAYYYLHLKRLLESKEDYTITKDDYVNLIKEIETDFFKEVQSNLRVKALRSFKSNLKMLFNGEKYSRSDRMAELYDWHFMNKFLNDSDSNGDGKISMRELIINPCRSDVGPNVREYNLTRINKVPMLILNATTLNTGRNWQFTAADMGEREQVKNEQNRYNKNTLFTAFKFNGEEIKNIAKKFDKESYEKYYNFPLKIAVAASAGVPGLFTPLSLTKLYENSVPQLVDGGVFDNQGISPIIYEECNEIIISDASGQMDFIENVRNDPIGVTKRTNSIMMNRIRNLEFEYLDHKQTSKHVNKEIFLHLREDLEPGKIVPGKKFESEIKGESKKTYYGINKEVQFLLSKLRTDLDSFTEIEAYSLMYSGYCMTRAKLVKDNFIDSAPAKTEEWKFIKVKEFCEDNKNKEFISQLANGQETVFKSTKSSPFILALELLILLITMVISIVPVAIAITLSHIYDNDNFMKWTLIAYGITVGIFLLSYIIRFFKSIKKNIVFRISTFVISLFVAIAGFVVSRLYLAWINKKFNRMGELGRLKNS